jgi:hypothetical protein
MSNKPSIPTTIHATAAVSLVAIVSCALAGDALAGRLPAESSLGDRQLSARVATIVERVRASEATLLPHLPPEPKMAWGN